MKYSTSIDWFNIEIKQECQTNEEEMHQVEIKSAGQVVGNSDDKVFSTVFESANGDKLWDQEEEPGEQVLSDEIVAEDWEYQVVLYEIDRGPVPVVDPAIKWALVSFIKVKYNRSETLFQVEIIDDVDLSVRCAKESRLFKGFIEGNLPQTIFVVWSNYSNNIRVLPRWIVSRFLLNINPMEHGLERESVVHIESIDVTVRIVVTWVKSDVPLFWSVSRWELLCVKAIQLHIG